MDTELAEIQPVTITEQVYKRLKKQILSHLRKPGSRLIVNKIAQELGVSPSPVREALRLLEKDGLAQVTPNCGAVTAIPTLKKLSDIFHVRECLEALAVHETAKNVVPQDISYLDKILQNAKKAIEKNDFDRWSKWDDAFHNFFAERCDNATLQLMLEQMMDWVKYFRQETSGSPTPAESYKEHCAVFECIKAGDAEGAEKAIAKHVRNAFLKGETPLQQKYPKSKDK